MPVFTKVSPDYAGQSALVAKTQARKSEIFTVISNVVRRRLYEAMPDRLLYLLLSLLFKIIPLVLAAPGVARKSEAW